MEALGLVVPVIALVFSIYALVRVFALFGQDARRRRALHVDRGRRGEEEP